MSNYNDASNVGVGMPDVDGAIFVAPAGTAVPTAAELLGDLGSSFKAFGYVSTDGVTVSEDGETKELTAWGGKTIKVIQTSFKETATFTPIEINETVLKEQYGEGNVATSEVKTSDGKAYKVIESKHKGATLPSKVLVIKTCPTDDMVVVYVAQNAQLTERGDLALDGKDAQGRQMTYTCNADSDGNTMVSYTFKLAAAADASATAGE